MTEQTKKIIDITRPDDRQTDELGLPVAGFRQSYASFFERTGHSRA